MLRNIIKINVTRSLVSKNCMQKSISTTSTRREIFKIQDENDFNDRVLKEQKKLTICQFTATWCGPCKLMSPRIESVVNENKDKVSLAKVDIDELTDLSLEHDIQAVPVLAAFKKGKVVNKIVGLQDIDVLRKWVKSHID